MKKNLLYYFLIVICLASFVACASKRNAGMLDPEGKKTIGFDGYNISILTQSIGPQDFGEYEILKAEANETNARAEKIKAETKLRMDIMANPEKYKGVSLPISSYTDPSTPPDGKRSVYIFNVSSERVLKVRIPGATIADQPDSKMASIPYGEKLGKVFYVKGPKITLYSYTLRGELFDKPKKMYVPRERLQATNWKGDDFDKIIGINNPKHRY